MTALRPRSLMGQMLLALAAALLLVQGLGAFLIYRAQRDSYESAMLATAAFRVIGEVRGDNARPAPRSPDRPFAGPAPRSLRLEHAPASPQHEGEVRDDQAETGLRKILVEQSFPVDQVVIVHRQVDEDPVARHRVSDWFDRTGLGETSKHRAMHDHLLVVGVKPLGQPGWLVARVRSPRAMTVLLWPLVLQTLVIYVVLMVAVTLILRRITRPVAALTRRVERFAATRDPDGQLDPTGPDDIHRLIVAHNAMEASIAAMLDEKDVMLGAIGHDLKTPLAALRVRIESVEDDNERGRMAATIEDIVRTLDDILSLARVGRPSDPLERTELSALVSSIVEEYEDMEEPVELVRSARIVLDVRPTWLRRALRNLISNGLRYGARARVSLERQGARAVMLVDDDGPGIEPSAIETMMNAFTRGDPSRNTATGGAGLGLALARAIAEQHGGSLKLDNRLDADGAVVGLRARLEIPVTSA